MLKEEIMQVAMEFHEKAFKKNVKTNSSFFGIYELLKLQRIKKRNVYWNQNSSTIKDLDERIQFGHYWEKKLFLVMNGKY